MKMNKCSLTISLNIHKVFKINLSINKSKRKNKINKCGGGLEFKIHFKIKTKHLMFNKMRSNITYNDINYQ